MCRSLVRLHRGALQALATAFVCGATPAPADTPLHPCDRYFADPMVDGLEYIATSNPAFELADLVDTVVPICTDAIARHPEEPRFTVFQYRALLAWYEQDDTALEPLAESSARMLELAEAGDPLAQTTLFLFPGIINNLVEIPGLIYDPTFDQNRMLQTAIAVGYQPARFVAAIMPLAGLGPGERAVGETADALQALHALADEGYPPAAFYLGETYDSGRGVAQDTDLTLQWYSRAAENGHRLAQASLGHFYLGIGAPHEQHVDPVRGTYWLARSNQPSGFVLRRLEPEVIEAAAGRFLVELGYMLPPDDDANGTAARAAVLAFQRDYGWPERDGAVTPDLLVAMARALDWRTP